MDTGEQVAGGQAGYSGVCPFTVDKPVMRQRWERLTFLHWAYDPDVVQRLLPGWPHGGHLRRGGLGGPGPVLHAGAHAGRPGRPLGLQLLRDQRAHLRAGPRGPGRHLVPVAGRRAPRGGRGGPGQLPAALLLVLDAAHCVSHRAARIHPPGRGPGGRVLLPAAAAGPAPGGQPGAHPRGCAVPDRRTGGPGPFPDRPVGAVQRAGRTAVLRPRRAPAVAAAPGGGPDRGRRPDRAAGLPAPRGEPLVHYSPGVDVRIGRPERYRGPAGTGSGPRPAARPRSAPPGPDRSTSGR